MSSEPARSAESFLPGPLLLVDDSYAFRERLARAFRDRGFDVMTAADYDEAMESAKAKQPRLAVLDLRMPGQTGLELLRDLKEACPDVEVLMRLDGEPVLVRQANVLAATFHPELGDDPRVHERLLETRAR